MTQTEEASATYREFIPDESYPRFSKRFLAKANAYEWLQDRLVADPFVSKWIAHWRDLLAKPFKGITTNGAVQQGLYSLVKPTTNSNAPVALKDMVVAATKFYNKLSPDQREKVQHDIDAQEFRSWSNPELYVFRHGLRLEECPEEVVESVHQIMKVSLSPSGYAKARGCMKVNRFLGDVVDGHGVLNECSYNFSLFGKPSLTAPWGWQLTGHHLCLNVFVLGSQQIISPVFMGAEPNIVDEGPDCGLILFDEQEKAGRKAMACLDPVLQRRVQIYKRLKDETMPEWRFHRADQRHLGGAFQDNRIIPYEGVVVTSFPSKVQQAVKEIVELALDFLPTHAWEQKMAEIERNWNETHFCWIGGWGTNDAFYYKIHSPVTMLEFDHHSGVFLTNKDARPFHIHTLVRTPNGNDYGKELLRQYKAQN